MHFNVNIENLEMSENGAEGENLLTKVIKANNKLYCNSVHHSRRVRQHYKVAAHYRGSSDYLMFAEAVGGTY